MKAFLIDPVAKTVTEVSHDESRSLDSIYGLIQADCFDVVTINDKRDGVYVDDEGLFKEERHAFMFYNSYSPLVGRGLILGCDDEGQTIEPHVTLDQVTNMVRFLGRV